MIVSVFSERFKYIIILMKAMIFEKKSNYSRLFGLFILLVGSSLILSGCQGMDAITGNVVYEGECRSGNIVEKVIKGEQVEMCCFVSGEDEREVRSCKSDDLKYSEVTMVENGVITQRKVSYPYEDMQCKDVYGRMQATDPLEMIPELSSCS